MTAELDMLISGGTLLTMSDAMEKVRNAEIGIKDGNILFVRPMGGGYPVKAVKEIIDASGCLILPGLINTHTHLPMVCFRGLADDLPLNEWLTNHIFPAEARYVNRDMVYCGSLLGIAEMLLSGTTSFCDGYFFSSSIARAAMEAGMRGIIGQGIIDYPTADNPDPSKHLAIATGFVNKWKGVSPLITPALFCHSPYTCSPETLKNIKCLTSEHDLPYLIHVSETLDEVKVIKDRYGLSPVGHLEKLGVLDNRTVAIHCVWVDDEEIDILARCGTGISHTPESNMKLATGVAPVPKMRKRGIAIGLGTDGCASNNDLDLILEMGTAARIHKVDTMDPTVISAETALKMATIEGARILGLDDRIGSIEPGKCADIIILDMKKPHLTPVYNEYSHVVYAASGADVKTTLVNGRVVMRDRKILSFDMRTAMEKVRAVAQRIIEDRSRGIY